MLDEELAAAFRGVNETSVWKLSCCPRGLGSPAANSASTAETDSCAVSSAHACTGIRRDMPLRERWKTRNGLTLRFESECPHNTAGEMLRADRNKLDSTTHSWAPLRTPNHATRGSGRQGTGACEARATMTNFRASNLKEMKRRLIASAGRNNNISEN
eukprot:5304364-Pleurochrysis_carterae.AAC.1